MSLSVVGFRKLAFPFSVGNLGTMCSLSPNRGLRRSGWLVGNPEVIPPTFAGAAPECTHAINTGMRHTEASMRWMGSNLHGQIISAMASACRCGT